MGVLSTLITAISDDVVASLAAASYPPLCADASGNAGVILVGSAKLYEQAAPPRIIFEPVGHKFSTANYASASATLTTQERKVQNAQRTIAADDVLFNVRCWGVDTTGIEVDDYDMTRILAHAVRAAMQRVMPGAFAIEESGKYTDGSNVNRSGRELVFSVTIFTPVLSSLLPYSATRQYAPVDVSVTSTDRMILPDGSGASEPGCA